MSQIQLLADLHQRLAAKGASITFDPATLGSGRMSAHWTALLNADPLTVTEAVVSDPDASGNFAVSGRMPWLKTGEMAVQFTFFASRPSGRQEDQLECVIKPSGAVAAWDLATEYPDMPGYFDVSPAGISAGIQSSFLKSLDFRNVSFAFSSYDFLSFGSAEAGTVSFSQPVDRVGAGLSFNAGASSASPAFDAIRLLKSDLGSLELSGLIRQDGAGLTLAATHEFDNAALSLASGVSLALRGLTIESGLSSDSPLLAGFSVQASIGRPEAPFFLTLRLNPGSKEVSIEGSAGDGHVFGISEIEEMLGLSGAGLASNLPANTGESDFGDLGIRDLRFSLSLSPLTVRRISVAVAASRPWKIVSGKITVSPFLNWTIEKPFGTAAERSTSLEIIGRWLLGGTNIDLYASILSGDFSAQMASNQTLDVTALFRDLLPGIPAPSLELLTLEVYGNYLANAYSLEVAAGGHWEIDLGPEKLKLEEVRLAGEYAGNKVTEWSMYGRLHLAGIGLEAGANYDQSGWDFRGGLIPEEELDLGSFFHRLISDFASMAHVSLPSSVPDHFVSIKVSGLSIEYASQTKTLTTHANLAGPVSIFESFQLDAIATQFVIGPAGLDSAVVKVRMTLGGVACVLAAAKDPGKSSWTFAGGTGPGQKIPIGNLVRDLGSHFGDFMPPAPLAGLEISELQLSFNTGAADFRFNATCAMQFPLDGRTADASITIDITKNEQGGYDKKFGGTLHVGTVNFSIDFSQSATETLVLGSYSGTLALNLKSLVSEISTTVADFIPNGLELDLNDVVLGYDKTGATSTFLLGLDLDIKNVPSLSALPLVGKLLPANDRIDLKKLRVLVASQVVDPALTRRINTLLPGAIEPISDAAPLNQGATVSAAINFGGAQSELAIPVTGGARQGQAAQQPATQPAVTSSDSAKWITVQKSFGPVHFNRAGVEYKDSALMFLLDATLSAAGLTLSLDGLGFGSPLSHFQPTFSIRGLGIDYSSGPVEIGGAFLHYVRESNGVKFDEYDGGVLIRTKALTLSAFGSYAYLNNAPSLFIYAVLDYPLGGPAFFFVTGLAAGFGYNRALRLPGLDSMARFPLVAIALSQSSGPPGRASKPADKNDLSTVLQTLQQTDAIPPTIGQYFLALGIRFTSFKLIDSFALLTVAFGREFEMNLLGLSTAVIPTREFGNAISPIAQVQMALRATFRPSEGFLGVAAQLTSSSYILSSSCHLTGGFAFYSWFSGDHSGDFVVTVGGYHPHFTKPPHYPTVPRLGINWQVNSELTIKGEAYFALTSSALMAGGSLQVVWESGSLKAWFTAQADFLLGWKPFHYEGSASVSIGVSYTYHFFGTHHINVDVSAGLEFWGPEFSGTAHVKLWIVSFTISFGSSYRPAQAISWDVGEGSFEKSFLPDRALVCTISVTGGLIRSQRVEADHSDLWVLNGKQLRIVTNSVIPSKKGTAGGAAIETGTDQFGVAPASVGAAGFDTTHAITITRNGTSVEQDFQCRPIFKKVPWAMWGTSMSVTLNGPSFVDRALAGYEITPAAKDQASETAALDRELLRYDPFTVPGAFGWIARTTPFQPAEKNETERKAEVQRSLASADVAAARSVILGAMRFQSVVSVTAAVADVFVVQPRIGASE